MPFLRPRILEWTHHARAKMSFYKLSEARVRRVIHSPRRAEEGVAPKTVAMMQPASVRWTAAGKPASVKNVIPGGAGQRFVIPADSDQARKGKMEETWGQEIWVMIQDAGKRRKIISAWRYPGRTKPRSELTMNVLRQEYEDYSFGGGG